MRTDLKTQLTLLRHRLASPRLVILRPCNCAVTDVRITSAVAHDRPPSLSRLAFVEADPDPPRAPATAV